MTNALITAKWFKSGKRGIIPVRVPEFGEWESALDFVIDAREQTPWLIGDLLNIGKAAFPEKYTQALNIFPGFHAGTLKNYASVCNKVNHPQRNENVSYSHHAAIAKFEPKLQEAWLNVAEKHPEWSVVDFRREINETNGIEVNEYAKRIDRVKEDLAWLIENAPDPEIARHFEIIFGKLKDAEKEYKDAE